MPLVGSDLIGSNLAMERSDRNSFTNANAAFFQTKRLFICFVNALIFLGFGNFQNKNSCTEKTAEK